MVQKSTANDEVPFVFGLFAKQPTDEELQALGAGVGSWTNPVVVRLFVSASCMLNHG
jgi:hypothetical protein